MRKRFIVPALVVGLALTSCAATADAGRSIPEVREALKTQSIKDSITGADAMLRQNTEFYQTTYELERDLLVCETLHPVPAGHPVNHPESVPLADCVKGTFDAYRKDA